MKDKRRRNAIIIVVCFIAFVLGIFLLFYNYFIAKRDLAFETINLQINDNKEPEIREETTGPSEIQNDSTEDIMKSNNTSSKYDYIGILEIPKIGLVKGFVDINSKWNNVDYNLQIIKPSDFPDAEGGNFIIASHSGSSSISYFKNLYQLSTGDEVLVYYNDIKYTYNIVNIYTQPKNGYVNIYRDESKTSITLITCTKNDDTMQTVYIGELVSKESY